MLKKIDFEKFSQKSFDAWENGWFVLTAGDYSTGDFNSMTVAWGSFGSMWSKPLAMIVVRPIRFTFGFLEKYDSFTLCAFPEEFREKVRLLGSISGRSRRKIAESGLTPIPSEIVKSPGYAESNLIIECRKIYWQDMDPNNFLSKQIHSKYPEKDYHRIYFGEIVQIRGISSFER